MAISQENRYKNGINVTFIVPQTWFLAFHISNVENYLKFDNNDTFWDLFINLRRSNINPQRLKRHQYSKTINTK